MICMSAPLCCARGSVLELDEDLVAFDFVGELDQEFGVVNQRLACQAPVRSKRSVGVAAPGRTEPAIRPSPRRPRGADRR
jgi:hypothetical protein